jgi:hypothetical protein
MDMIKISHVMTIYTIKLLFFVYVYNFVLYVYNIIYIYIMKYFIYVLQAK